MTEVLVIAAFVIAIAVVALAWRRHVVDRPGDAFRCTLQPIDEVSGCPGRPLRRSRARWVHDVLVVDSGFVIRRTRVLPVKTVHGSIEPTVCGRRLKSTISLRVELDDGSAFRIFAEPPRIDSLGGPFLTAQPTIRSTRTADPK